MRRICPVCGQELKPDRRKFVRAYLFTCRVCGTKLKFKPSPLYSLLFVGTMFGVSFFASLDNIPIAILVGAVGVALILITFDHCPFLPTDSLGIGFTDLEEARILWKKKNGEWMKEQRENEKKDEPKEQ